jgi:hypothetical protein
MNPTIREVSFRRKFNLGNYETMDVELVATTTPDQNPIEVLKALDAKTIEFRKARSV